MQTSLNAQLSEANRNKIQTNNNNELASILQKGILISSGKLTLVLKPRAAMYYVHKLLV